MRLSTEAYAADDMLAPDCRAFAARLRAEVGAEAGQPIGFSVTKGFRACKV